MTEPERQPYEPGPEESKVYDQDSDSPTTRPNLRALEGGGQGNGVPSGNLRPLSDNSQGSKSPEDLRDSESGINSNDKPSKSLSDQVGKGFTGASASGGTLAAKSIQRFVGSTRKHKKGLLIGGGVGGTLILLLGGFFAFIVQYELVHIEENLVRYESKIDQHFEKKAAQKLLQKSVCMQVDNGCKGDGTDKKPTAAEETDAEAKGEVLTENVDSFSLTDPVVEADLAKGGITVETNPTTGDLTGLKDASGNITQDIGTNTAVFNEFETALPEWEVGQLEAYRPLMVDQVDASFSGIPTDTAPDEVDKTIEDTVTNGGDQQDLLEAEGEQDTSSKPPANDTNTASQSTLDQTQKGELGNAESIVEKDLAAGKTDLQAETDAASAFKLGDPLFLSSVLNDACSIKGAADTGAISRVPGIMKLLERHGNLLISMANQIKSGKMTGAIVNQVMQLFNGNSAQQVTKSNPTPSDPGAALPFNSSAGWQRATGGEVTSHTPDINPSSLPTANSGTKLVNRINELLPGSGLICKVSSSPFSFIATAVAGGIQIFGDGFSFGTAQAGIIAGTVAFQYELSHTLVPDIIKYFTPIGINGGEDAVQQLNNSDAGLNASYSNYARSQGAIPVSNTTADSLTTESSNDQTVAEAQLPWTSRTFAISNPDSLVSHIADTLPSNLASTIQGIGSYLLSFPSILGHDFSSIFNSKVFAQANPTNPGQPYGITEYSFTDSEVDKYDPISNEKYLFTPIDINVNGTTTPVIPITALGNPNTYKPTALPVNTDGSITLGDTNNNDMLHCFVDSFVNIEEANSSPNLSTPPYQDPGADQNCGSLGMYDYSNDNAVSGDTINNLPDDNTAAAVYCESAGVKSSDTVGLAVCINQTAPKLSDDIGRYRQYLLDLNVMNSYKSLTNNQ